MIEKDYRRWLLVCIIYSMLSNVMLHIMSLTSDCAHRTTPEAKFSIILNVSFDIIYHDFEILSLIESYFAACTITYLARQISPMRFLNHWNQRPDRKSRFREPIEDRWDLHLERYTLNPAAWVAVKVDEDIITSYFFLLWIEAALECESSTIFDLEVRPGDCAILKIECLST